MPEDLIAHGVQQFVFRFEMRIKCTSADIRQINDFLYGDVIVTFLAEQDAECFENEFS